MSPGDGTGAIETGHAQRTSRSPGQSLIEESLKRRQLHLEVVRKGLALGLRKSHIADGLECVVMNVKSVKR